MKATCLKVVVGHLVYTTFFKAKTRFQLRFFEAEDKVDSGDIWKKTHFILEDHELADEINRKMSLKTLELMDFAIDNFNKIKPIPQKKTGETYFPRRTPENSELDVNKTIAEQFDLMRVADENRYPCFIFHKGYRYKLTLRKY